MGDHAQPRPLSSERMTCQRAYLESVAATLDHGLANIHIMSGCFATAGVADVI
jgi:hypothetical protein